MAGRALLLAAVCPLALAFSNTLPVITWASHSSNIFDLIPSTLPKSTTSGSLLGKILSHDDICDYDAVVLVEQPGLRASDLRSLPTSSSLAKTLISAPAARQFPYVPSPSSGELSSLAQSLSSRCGSRIVSMSPGQGGVTLESGVKHVITMDMPHLNEVAADRRRAMTTHDSDLASELEVIASILPNYLVVYTGSSIPLSKRQIDETTPDDAFPSFQPNSTLPEGGILKRYQLLTPGLITVLLVVFFLLVPIVMLGINALASIQSPLRVEAPKGYNAQDKKNQ